jgi:hypothetical protein
MMSFHTKPYNLIPQLGVLSAGFAEAGVCAAAWLTAMLSSRVHSVEWGEASNRFIVLSFSDGKKMMDQMLAKTQTKKIVKYSAANGISF